MSDPFDRNPEVTYGIAQDVGPLAGVRREQSTRVRRVTCQNPSPMTFTGTQSYLVGSGDLALIDPGPENRAHLAAIQNALEPGERIAQIIVTHSHVDHSPGARAIAEATGASIHGFGPHGSGMSETMLRLKRDGVHLGGGEGGDHAFDPDHVLGDGDSVGSVTGGWEFVALHTPGHLSNHICLELVGADILFSGDTVMGWATTLVSPPEGDMAAFMASLDRLAAHSAGCEGLIYLPGHGHPVRDPSAMVAHQIAHREARLTQILEGLTQGPADAWALTHAAYQDVDPALLPAARRNVLAGLIGLMDQGLVRPRGPLSVDAEFERV